ncbi:MAG: HAD family hydrolase [Caldilineaceae bacterium]|nr:HAD family hydrolase [Caldilineaceae bacterium]
MLQAIIFDFDGTILDTERHDYGCWSEIYQAHKVELPLATWSNIVGTVHGDFDPHQLLETLTGRSFDRAELRAQRRQRLVELVEQEALRPGVQTLIEAAQTAGLRLGVASSGTRDWVEGHLVSRGLRGYFGVVRTVEDVARAKPDPELYLSALAALGVAPEHALAIEDSRHGMMAAKAAGMKCLVVPNEITQSFDFSEADLVLRTLAGVDLDRLFAAG